MFHFNKILLIASLFLLSFNTVSALEESDRKAIHEVILGYTESWNHQEGKGFGDGFTEDADFVNIFGMHFSGKNEIEERHVKILKTFLKGTTLEILDTQLREVQPGLVIALIRWKLHGLEPFKIHKDINIREGIFTQVFINSNNKWEITASQNTLISK